MAPRTIRPVSAFIVKVSGSISATPIAADRPGIQPMMMPMDTPAAIISRLIGVRALRKPAPIMPKVSSIFQFPPYRSSLKISPLGSFTPRNLAKAKYTSARMTATAIAVWRYGTFRYSSRPIRNSAVAR